MTYRERHQIMTQQHGLRQQQTNISSKLMFGLGQAGADWKWTSDTTTTVNDIEADDQVTEDQEHPKTTDDDLSTLEEIYQYYWEELR